MNTYIYQAALLCEECATKTMQEIDKRWGYPEGYTDRCDSDEYPKGPHSDGGGESDTPQHCDSCDEFLENPLTDEGDNYVRDAWFDGVYFVGGPGPAVQEWKHYYNYLF